MTPSTAPTARNKEVRGKLRYLKLLLCTGGLYLQCLLLARVVARSSLTRHIRSNLNNKSRAYTNSLLSRYKEGMSVGMVVVGPPFDESLMIATTTMVEGH